MSRPHPDRLPPPLATGRITLRELGSDRPFLLYLTGQTTSGAGSALSSVALVFAVMAISRSAAGVGLVLLAARLPGVALALAGGVVADRWSRRWLAVGADVVRTATQAAAAALLLAGRATVPELAALQVIAGGASAIFTPAANAQLASVAPRGQIRRASSLLGITTSVAQMGGLAISGVLVATAGPGIALAVDATTFAVSALTLACVPSPRVAWPPARSARTDLREGWRVIGERGWLVVYACQETVINVLVLSPFFVLGPIIARARLGGAPGWSAIALGYVIGSLAASAVTYRWAPRRPMLAALAITIALAPMLAALGLSAPLWVVVLAASLAGAESTITNTLVAAALQANLPDHALGRATAITSLGSVVLVPVSMGLSGIAAAAFGPATVMLGAAGVVLVTTVICVCLPAARAVLALDRQP